MRYSSLALLILFVSLGGFIIGWMVKPPATTTTTVVANSNAVVTANTTLSPYANTIAVTNASNSNAANVVKLSSTLTLDDLGEPHLTADQATTLLANLEDPNRYQATTNYSLDGNCGTTVNATIMSQLNTTRKVQMVNTSVPILWTPNTQNWTKAAADAFVADPTVVCGVASFVPFEVKPDHILWRLACSSGVGPDKNSPNYPSLVQCYQAQEVISKNFGLTD